MDIKKILVLIVAMALMCTPAFAGEQPEYDVVGCDADAAFNDFIKVLVCQQNAGFGTYTLLNQFSNFCFYNTTTAAYDCRNTNGREHWVPPSIPGAGLDPCFTPPFTGLPNQLLAKVGAGNPGTWKWIIVLQKKPETDLNVNIVDCVVKMNSPTMFGDEAFEGAFQTGWMLYPWGELAFDLTRNPKITVNALPGPFAGFTAPFNVNSRTLTGLSVVPLLDAYYTSKGPWEEGIVVAKPVTGDPGQTTLIQGDALEITITLPPTNTADVRYGQQSVVVKYVGIHGDIFPDMRPLPVPQAACGPCARL